MLTTIKNFSGINRLEDSTGRKQLSIERAEGVVLRPLGGFSRVPGYQPLWELSSLSELKDSLGINATDNTCCIKLVNEGETFLVFYDFANGIGLGIFYAGKDSEFVGTLEDGPTLTESGATKQVLWRGLSPRVRWNGTLISGRLYMGNGVDSNLVYDVASNFLSVMGANITPLAPKLNLTDMVNADRVQSTLETGGLRFEADECLGGVKGNYVTVVVQGGTGANFISSISGRGTFCDPFEYVVTCPSPLPTNEQLALFIARDPKAKGILKCEFTASGTSQVPLFPSTTLSRGADRVPQQHSGVDNQVADEFESTIHNYVHLGIKVFLTYIKKDDRLGIVESAPSPTAMIETAWEGFTAHAVQVSIEKDADFSEAANWTGIRVYASEICMDCTCERKDKMIRLFELSNESQSVMIYPWHVNSRAREDNERDGLMANVANLLAAQPPEPVKSFVFANDRVYMAGNYAEPLRIYHTRQQEDERVLIETTGEKLYRDLIPQGPGSNEITALAEFRGGVVAFAGRTAYSPDTDAAQTLLSAPLNQHVGVNWINGSYYYLGQDFNLYRVDALPDDTTNAPLDALVSEKIAGYIRDYADVTDAIFPHSAVDFTNRIWWIWVRGKFGGTISFAFDFEEGELTGPFYLPQFISVTSISPADGRFVGQTARGELFVWNLRKLGQSFSKFENSAGVSLIDSTSTGVTASEQKGYGLLYLKNGKSLLKSNVVRLQTGWMDLGDSENVKGFYEFHWTVVNHSAGVVCLHFETDEGISKTVYYGEVFGKERHKVLTLLSGIMLRATFTVWVEDDKDFAVRDWAIRWKEQGAK